MHDAEFYQKLIDLEKDMQNLREKCFSSFGDRLCTIESNVTALFDRTSIFMPESENNPRVGFEAYIGKVNSKLKHHAEEIRTLKSVVAKVEKA